MERLKNLKTARKVLKTGVFDLATPPRTFRWAKIDSSGSAPVPAPAPAENLFWPQIPTDETQKRRGGTPGEPPSSNALKALRIIARGWCATPTPGNRPIIYSFTHPMGEGGRRPDEGRCESDMR